MHMFCCRNGLLISRLKNHHGAALQSVEKNCCCGYGRTFLVVAILWQRFKQRIFAGIGEEASEPKHWWGIANPHGIKGWFIPEIRIALGRYAIPPAELREMLPQQLLMLEVAANALVRCRDRRINHRAFS